MTEIERRLVIALWNALFGTMEDLARSENEEAYKLLHRLHWVPVMKPSERDALVKLAWRYRRLLPADLVLAAALKGGVLTAEGDCSMSEHMITGGDGDTVPDPEEPRPPLP